MSRIFAAIDRIDSQWLTTWVLSALVATLVLSTVRSAVVSPLDERTKTTLFDLQFSGLHPWLTDGPEAGLMAGGGIGLGALAALLDEGENAFLWFMLARPDQDPGRLVPALATALAIGKYALLAAVVLITVLALRRARA